MLLSIILIKDTEKALIAMHNAFEELDKLIIVAAAPAGNGQALYPEQHYTTLSVSIMAACGNARSKIIHAASCITDRSAFALFIRNCQHTLTDLLDYIHGYRTDADAPCLTTLYDRADIALESLYYLLKDRYNEFFSIDANIPRKLLEQQCDELRRDLPALKAQVKQRLPGSDWRFIAFAPVEKVLAGAQRVSWRRLRYLQKLLLMLKRFADSSGVRGEVEWDFIALLIQMGLNTDAAYDCCREYIGRISGGPGSLEEKVDKMDLLQNSVQLLVGYGRAYREDMTPVKDYWQQVLQVESAQLEKKWMAEQRKNLKGLILIREKMKSLFNVTQDGIWVRALMYARKIEKRAINEMAKIWTDCVESKGQKNVSPESLEKKSAPGAPVKDWEIQQILDVLHDMIEYVVSVKRARVPESE